MVKQNEKRGLITKTFSSLSFKHDPFSLPWLRRTNVLSKYYPHRPPYFKGVTTCSYCDEICPCCGSKETRIYYSMTNKGYFCFCNNCHFFGLIRPTAAEAKIAWRIWNEQRKEIL